MGKKTLKCLYKVEKGKKKREKQNWEIWKEGKD